MIPVPTNPKSDPSIYEMFHKAGERLETCILRLPDEAQQKDPLAMLDVLMEAIYNAVDSIEIPPESYEAEEAAPIQPQKDVVDVVDEQQLDDQGEEINRDTSPEPFQSMKDWATS